MSENYFDTRPRCHVTFVCKIIIMINNYYIVGTVNTLHELNKYSMNSFKKLKESDTSIILILLIKVGTGNSRNLPKVTEQIKAAARIQTDAASLQSPKLHQSSVASASLYQLFNFSHLKNSSVSL